MHAKISPTFISHRTPKLSCKMKRLGLCLMERRRQSSSTNAGFCSLSTRTSNSTGCCIRACSCNSSWILRNQLMLVDLCPRSHTHHQHHHGPWKTKTSATTGWLHMIIMRSTQWWALQIIVIRLSCHDVECETHMLLSSYTLKFLLQLIQLDAAGFQLLYIRLIDSPPPPPPTKFVNPGSRTIGRHQNSQWLFLASLSLRQDGRSLSQSRVLYTGGNIVWS
jgi:hypothetical protein